MSVIPDMSFLNNPFKNIKPNINFNELTSAKDLSNEQIKAINGILEFMERQQETANKQFKTSRNLILATIIIMILQIGYAVWSNYESNSKQNNLTKIIETQSIQSEAISRMSKSLLDLSSQVRNLEIENAKLLKKK